MRVADVRPGMDAVGALEEGGDGVGAGGLHGRFGDGLAAFHLLAGGNLPALGPTPEV